MIVVAMNNYTPIFTTIFLKFSQLLNHFLFNMQIVSGYTHSQSIHSWTVRVQNQSVKAIHLPSLIVIVPRLLTLAVVESVLQIFSEQTPKHSKAFCEFHCRSMLKWEGKIVHSNHFLINNSFPIVFGNKSIDFTL
jgi:hypothetical protein